MPMASPHLQGPRPPPSPNHHPSSTGAPLLSAPAPTSSQMTPSPSGSSLHAEESAKPTAPGRITVHLVSQFTYSSAAALKDDEDGAFLAETATSSQYHRRPPAAISAKPKHSVRRIKAAVQASWPGKPSADGIRLIHAGRILGDDELVASLVKLGQTEAYLHLVVRPDAWQDIERAPLTPQPRLEEPSSRPSRLDRATPVTQSNRRLLRPPVSPLPESSYFTLPTAQQHSEQSTGTDGAYHRHTPTLGDLVAMPEADEILAAIHLRYFVRYSDVYERFISMATASEGELHQRANIRRSWLTNESADAEGAFSEFEQVIFKWQPLSETNARSTDRRYATTVDAELRDCADRLSAVSQLLGHVRKLRDLDTLHQQGLDVSSAWVSSGLNTLDRQAQRMPHQLRASALPTREMFMAALQAHAQTQNAAVRDAPTSPANALFSRLFSPITRLTWRDWLHVLDPVFFLSVKLGLLLYIFTQRVSPTQKAIMYAIAVCWVAFETWRLWRRRLRRLDSAQRRRLREAAARGDNIERQQRRARRHTRRSARAAATTPSTTSDSQPAHSDQVASSLLPLAPLRFTNASFMSLDYWRQNFVFYGLEEEDQDLGFRPNSSQVTRWATRSARQRLASASYPLARSPASLLGPLMQVLRWLEASPALLFMPLYLYVLTLVPQLEEARASEVRRRQRSIKKWWTTRGKEWVDEQRRKEEEQNAEIQASASSATAPSSANDSVLLPRILQHPYVLETLQLRRTPDGLVEPVDGQNGADGSGRRQIDIQEEIDAMWDAQLDRNALRRRRGGVPRGPAEQPRPSPGPEVVRQDDGPNVAAATGAQVPDQASPSPLNAATEPTTGTTLPPPGNPGPAAPPAVGDETEDDDIDEEDEEEEEEEEEPEDQMGFF